MALLRLQDIEISFGDKPVLDKVNLVVEEHERIAIVGRNGTGKSTMMKVIDNSITFDAGERIAEGEVIISRLEQEVPGALEGSIFDVVADDKIAVLELIDQLADSSRSVDEIEQIQLQIEQQDGWSVKQKVDTVISKLSLDPTRKFKQLSGGLKRRVLLARALLQEPDILLLDEPTNHLDIEAIKWLENFLSNFMGAVVFISHDRSFLSRVCTRIVELDRGYLSSWPGDYDEFLYRKAQAMAVEQAANERFDKKVQKEEEWIRQGVKARRKRNEGRVRALEDMRETLANRRKVQRNARIKIMAGELSGRKVVEVKNLSYKIGDLPIVNKFETLIKRGDKIALIGPNGVGKTTFLKLLLGELTPDMGKIKIGTNLQVAYFDQNRTQLDENASVRDSLDNGAEHVIINGRSRHVMAYLSNFLFSSKKAQSPVNALSGGERNRLLLAKLFIKPANLLVLDEPTNDLDMDTLELLEDVLINYDGTILLVSHDRYFVNQVVDACIVFKGDGEVEYFKGNYDEWLAYDKQYNQQASLAAKAQADKQAEAAASSAASEKKANKLSYKFQRELDALPDDIATLETEIEALELQMSDPGFYQQDISLYQPILDQLAKQQARLDEKMERWVELEGMVSG